MIGDHCILLPALAAAIGRLCYRIRGEWQRSKDQSDTVAVYDESQWLAMTASGIGLPPGCWSILLPAARQTASTSSTGPSFNGLRCIQDPESRKAFRRS